MVTRNAVLLCLLVMWLSTGLALYAQSTVAFTSDAATTPDATRIGWFLEQEFSPYFSSCSNNHPMKSKQGAIVSTIPAPVLTAIGTDVWSWVSNKKNYSAAVAFSIITKDKVLPDSPDDQYQLGMNILQDPGTMLAAGTSSTLYSSNCTSIVAAAASVDSNLQFSIANLSTVAKADYQNSDKGELGLINGDFNSPFFQMYGGLISPASTEFAHLLLWDWYRSRYAASATIPNETFYALAWFNGYSMYQVSKSQRNADGSVKIGGGANYLGLVSVSGSLGLQFQNFGATSVNNYAVAIKTYSPQPKYRFDPLDTPTQIATWAAQASSTTFNAPSSFSPVLSKALPSSSTHEQVFAAMPIGLCDHTLWKTNPGTLATAGGLQVVGERPIPKSETHALPACALSISFVPDASVWNQPTGTVITAQYSLDTKIAGVTLEIPAAPVAFSTSNFPSLQPAVIGPSGFKVTAVAPGPGSTVEWNINEALIDDPTDPIDRTAAITVLSKPQLSDCVAATGLIDVPASGASFSNNFVTVKIQQYFAGTPDSSDPTNTTCSVGLTLRFKTGKGNLVAAALPPHTLLAYPASGPTPAVVPHFVITRTTP